MKHKRNMLSKKRIFFVQRQYYAVDIWYYLKLCYCTVRSILKCVGEFSGDALGKMSRLFAG